MFIACYSMLYHLFLTKGRHLQCHGDPSDGWGCSAAGKVDQVDIFSSWWNHHGSWCWCTRPGKLTVCYWTWPSRNSGFTMIYPWISMNSMEISHRFLCWPDFGVTLWNPPVTLVSTVNVGARSFARQCVPSLPSSLGPNAREMTGLMSTGPTINRDHIYAVYKFYVLYVYIYI